MKKTINICPADRVNNIQEYYFSGKLREIATMNSEGADVISLGIGSPDRMPSHAVISSLREEVLKPDAHGYQPYTGIPALRKAMSRFYKKWYGVDLDPEKEIQPLIGSKEGILHISLAFLNPGDGVLIPDPGYPTYKSVSELAGAKIYTYNLTESNGWQPDFQALENLPTEKIKLMWVNYPHMPTGAPASIELFEKIVDFGFRHNIIIAHDNPYSFIRNGKPLSMLQIDNAKDIVIEMNSMSKSHNMAGWRIAMLSSNPQFIHWILKIKSNIDSGQFKPMLIAAAKGLESSSEWYSELNEVYDRRQKIAGKIMDALGCRYVKNSQGMFLWGRIPENEISSEEMADRILYNAKVFVTPGFIFGSNGERYIRISLCADEEKLTEALRRITALPKSSDRNQ